MRLYPLLLLTTVLGLAACDSGEPDERLVAEPGRFSAAVTFDDGDRIAFDGLASATPAQLIVLDSVFVGDDSLRTIDTLRTAFTITLGEFAGAGPGHFISLMREGDRPEPGTYVLGGFDRTGFFGVFSSFDGGVGIPDLGSVFASESGTLIINVSAPARVAGQAEFRARSFGFDGGHEEGQAATVRVAFDADIRALPDGFPRGVPDGG